MDGHARATNGRTFRSQSAVQLASLFGKQKQLSCENGAAAAASAVVSGAGGGSWRWSGIERHDGGGEFIRDSPYRPCLLL